jgi:hypothetical protein
MGGSLLGATKTAYTVAPPALVTVTREPRGDWNGQGERAQVGPLLKVSRRNRGEASDRVVDVDVAVLQPPQGVVERCDSGVLGT